MLQPGVAFLEEGLGLGRKASVALLGLVTALGSLFVWWFSKDLKALDTIDFWVGTLMIFIQGAVLIIVFGWSLGMERGWAEAHLGADLRIPRLFKPVIKYVSPAFLVIIFVLFALKNAFGWNFSLAHPEFNPTVYVRDLIGAEHSSVARLAVLLIAVFTVFTCVLINLAGRRLDAGTVSPPGGTKP
jgi:ABC-type Na+ efflux pump permease subunit